MKNNSFGMSLKQLRKEVGLNITDLAKVSGVSRPYLSQLESGTRNATPEILRKLADALGNISYAGLLELAGYEDLHEYEQLRSVFEDFGDTEGMIEMYERLKLCEQTKDIKNFLELNIKGVNNEEIRPFYNGHLLTESDRRRILNVLKELFPEYQEEGTDLTNG